MQSGSVKHRVAAEVIVFNHAKEKPPVYRSKLQLEVLQTFPMCFVTCSRNTQSHNVLETLPVCDVTCTLCHPQGVSV